MKRLLPAIVSSFFILMGIFIFAFVIRMVWFPPGPMGMMMERGMMAHHMMFWFGPLIWVIFIIAGILLVVWIVYRRKKR
ncbi:hypothetical protein UB32_06280 [Mesobacillus subterraneus]|uniref:Uncharacterized protein n=2 Tax=Mesobacillus TaxID=2675231 RepID=A0A0D6ZCN6_9BACI|nr:hypothetical protein UB32_06280 [Mesobacillus subterraneus]MDQ0413327.1 glucan phosphoethanolaminetransferase (alkaline phosphatase superfamily) [Mesobacillus stamsii]